MGVTSPPHTPLPQIAKDVKQFYDQALQQAVVDDDANNAKAVVKTFHETVREGAPGDRGGWGFGALASWVWPQHVPQEQEGRGGPGSPAPGGSGSPPGGDSPGPVHPQCEPDEPVRLRCRGL